MIYDLGLINNIDELFNNKIILFGAGDYGIKSLDMFKDLGVSVSFFCDNDPQKWGNFIEDVQIAQPMLLKDLDANGEIVIIITSIKLNFLEQIEKDLDKMNLNTKKIYSYYGLNLALSVNIENANINESFRLQKYYTDKVKNIYYETKFKIDQIVAIKQYVSDQEPIIFLYQPGKVGSTSIAAGLSEISKPYIYSHFLLPLTSDKDDAKIIYDSLKHTAKKRKVKIITVVREPIGRALSALFQCVDDFGMSLFMSKEGTFISKIEDMLTGRLFAGMDNAFSKFCAVNWMEWLDVELNNIFEINVLEYPFNQALGYSIIKKDNIELLTVKLEMMNNLERVICDFIEDSSFKIINKNEGSGKLYKYLYANVMAELKIPDEVLSIYYGNNIYTNYFYSKDEQTCSLKKWM